MRKLAMILAAILTLNLAAPAATAYAAPVDTVTGQIADEALTGADMSDLSTSGNEPSASGNEPSVSENEPSEPEGEPADPDEPSVSENEPSVSENEPSVSENEPSVSDNEPSVSENEPEKNVLYVQETYYKTSKGYPLVAALRVPAQASMSDIYFNPYQIQSLTLSVDDGEAKDLTVTKTVLEESGEQDPETYKYEAIIVGFNAGYDSSISQGIHTLAYEMVFSFGGDTYTVSGNTEAEFIDDSKATRFVYPATTQYMSANKGSELKSIYGGINVATKSETISSFKICPHGTEKAISYTVLDKNSYGGYETVDSRYKEMGGIYPWSIFNYDVYSASMISAIQLKNDIPEGDYDIIYTTSKGKKHIIENAYRATKKVIVFEAKSTAIKSKNIMYDAIPVYADNNGDYVSLFVYGLNLTKENVPTFYNADKSEALSEYLSDDKMCGSEEWEYGFDYTVKKKDASRGEWETSLPVLVSGDVLYVRNFSTEEKEVKYAYSRNNGKEHEWDSYNDTFRIYLTNAVVTEEDTITVEVYKDYQVTTPPTDSAKVQYDGSNYYAEFGKESIVYQAVKNNYWRIRYGINDESPTYAIWIGDIERPSVVKNISVPANCSWEVHAVSDVANAIYSGTTTTKKNVLNSAQVAALEGKGLHRICIYNAKGKVKDRYLVYFKGEDLYNITYELNGGKNHPDNPEKYGKSDAITLLTPTKEYHSFAGWYTDAKLTQKVTAIAKGSTGDKNFYAKWTPYTYTISYNANGGSGKMNAESCKYNVDTKIARNTFTRAGYEFFEWNTKKDGSGETYTEKQVVKNLSLVNKAKVQLYAIWKPITYTLVLDKNSEEAQDGTVETAVNRFDVAYDDVFTLTGDEYVHIGHEITSWKTDSGKKIANGDVSKLTTVSGNIVTLYAQWAIDNYTIMYNYDGGKVKKANPKTYTYESPEIIFEEPEKTGYEFDYFYTLSPSGDEIRIKGVSENSTGDLSVYTKWTPNNYTIKFEKNADDAQLKPDVQNTTVGMVYDKDLLTITDTYYQRPGYTLDSWNTKPNGKGIKYKVGMGYKNLSAQKDGEVILYAIWKKDTYTITYNLDGGKNHKNNPKKYTVDTQEIELKDPTRKGYIFDKWYLTDAEGNISENTLDKIVKGSTGNLILTAKWIPMIYTIKWNPNTNKYVSANNIESRTKDYTYAENIGIDEWTENFGPTKLWEEQGMGILYWSTKPNGGGTKYYPGMNYSGLLTSGTIELYAKWGLVPYSINYVGTEGINNPNPASYTYDDEAVIKLKDISKKGYVFDKWYTDPSFVADSKIEEIKRNERKEITLYAKFTPIEYTVKLAPNASDAVEGSGAKEFTKVYDEAFSVSANSYTREHYRIAYWSTKPNGKGTKVYSDVEKAWNLSANGATVTLYPKWQLVPYSIIYNNVEFSGEKVVNKSPSSYTYNVNKEVKLKNPTRTGYVFGGWYLEDTTAEGFNAVTATPVKKLAKGESGNKQLYALWTPITYKVQLEANGKNAVLGEGISKVQDVTYGQGITLADNSYIREGYNLVEFNTKKNGKGTSYALNAEHRIYASKANSTVKLYAIWEKVETKKVSGVELSGEQGTVTVWFAMNEGCGEYEVACSDFFTMKNAITIRTESNTASFSDLLSGQRYFVRVREIRYDSLGNEVKGPWSSLVSIKAAE